MRVPGTPQPPTATAPMPTVNPTYLAIAAAMQKPPVSEKAK